MIKERPILFSAPMVRAILDGRKTQTRRTIKNFPAYDAASNRWVYRKLQYASQDEAWAALHFDLPYGKIGDRLWVRETWARYNIDHESYDIAYRATKPNDWPANGRWRPSIHMPRWASRINLEITGIRVERLQKISEQDALAEGVSYDMGITFQSGDDTPIGLYGELWESINGQGSWDVNPWVWVIEFKRVQDKTA